MSLDIVDEVEPILKLIIYDSCNLRNKELVTLSRLIHRKKLQSYSNKTRGK